MGSTCSQGMEDKETYRNVVPKPLGKLRIWQEMDL